MRRQKYMKVVIDAQTNDEGEVQIGVSCAALINYNYNILIWNIDMHYLVKEELFQSVINCLSSYFSK